MVRAEVCSGGGANRQLCTSMVSCTSHSELNIPGVERLVLCGYANLEELQ
jgi:hypothetical protein